MSEIYCKYCGASAPSVASLTGGWCYLHPNGPNKGCHAVYEGSIKNQYTCKYCGSKSSSIHSLVIGYCYRHPNGPNKGGHSPTL